MASILSMGRKKPAVSAAPTGAPGGKGKGGGGGGGKSSGRANDAPHGVVFKRTNEATTGLVFGMKWRAVFEQSPKKYVMREATAAKATHLNHVGPDFGYCKLSRGVTKGMTGIYSAARMVRGQLGGNIIVALTLDRSKGEFWVCHFGGQMQPLEDVVITKEADLRLKVEALIASSSNTTLVTDLDGFHTDEDHPIRSFGYAELYDIRLSNADVLTEVQQRSSIPRPLIFGSVAVVGLMGASMAWDYYKTEQARADDLARRFKKTDPIAHWEKAYTAWLETQILVDGRQVMPVMQSLAAIPARWNGWVLETASCNLQMSSFVAAPLAPAVPASGAVVGAGTQPVSPSATWACSGSYLRSKTGVINTTMKPAIPATYVVSFLPLDSMQIAWSVPTGARRLTREEVTKLTPKSEHYVGTTATLQTIAPALTGTPIYKFTPARVPVPPTPEGDPVSPPGDFQLAIAPLEIAGPLRTIVKSINTQLPVAWSGLSMQLATAGSAPGIKTSSLSARFVGNIYANK